MDLRKLEAFLTVANTGKYTDAADKLFISQSSLSKQMAQMERELGVKLFKKTRNGVELTQAGFDFYSYVRKMLPEYHRAVDRLQMYREGGTYPCASVHFLWRKNTALQTPSAPTGRAIPRFRSIISSAARKT